ncbi:MAG: hypothetical protein QOE36_1637 [Gaiellaceae bacterium]|jgi:hypothetical protein|nr:hypothetical protein [Gaiellaceae bacterium]
MKWRLGSIAVGLVVAGVLAASASAVPPVLLNLSQKNGHLSATFSAPRAMLLGVWVARDPARNPDGSFPQANMALFTAVDDVTSGHWTSDQPLSPGTYWVVFEATPDNDCYDDSLNVDPSCSAGFSNELQIVIPKPKPKFTVESELGLAGPHSLTLTLTASPVYDDMTYRVCWQRVHPTKRRCLNRLLRAQPGTVDEEATDGFTVDTRGLGRVTKFTWSVDGSVVLSRRLRTGR